MTRVTTCNMMINGDHLQDHFAQVQMISGKMKQIEGGDEYDEGGVCPLHILIQSTMVLQATDVIMMIMMQVQCKHWDPQDETGLLLFLPDRSRVYAGEGQVHTGQRAQ